MKLFLNIIRLAVVIVAFGSCTKEEGLVPQLNRDRIAFSVNDPDITFDTQTRATAVTGSTIEVNGFYCSATTSGVGGDESAWNSVSFAKSGDYFVSDKVWPTSDPSFSFQASNVPITHGSSGCTVEASNMTDVVCAYVASPTYKSPSVLTFEHIFARIGNVTVSAVGGYTITGVSLTITPRTGGTYNIKTGVGQTDATGWSSLTTGSATTIFSGSTGTVSNDLYLVPGTYDLSFSWTVTKGDYSANLSRTVSGTFSRGCVSTVTAGLTGEATEIQFGISVNSWTACATDFGRVDNYVPLPPSFAGLMLASGPLKYNGSSFEIADSWNQSSYNSVYGKNSGSTYFSFIQLGQLFESPDFSTSSGSIDNILDPLSGWRMPTQSEWASIVGTSREGSTVNGVSGYHYAFVRLTGVMVNGSNTPTGCILFPDGEIITASRNVSKNSPTETVNFTLAQLNEYLEQGCVFLPPTGCYDNYSWNNGTNWGFFWSSNEYNSDFGYYSRFNGSKRWSASEYDMKGTYYYSVWLVKPVS